MPTNFIQQKKKQKYLLIVVILVVIITLLVLWFGREEKTHSSVVETRPVSFVKEIEIDLEILENPLVKKFQPFEKASPFDGIKGRENPFLPY